MINQWKLKLILLLVGSTLAFVSTSHANEESLVFFTENFPPLSFLNDENIVIGASVEIVEEAHRRLGLKPDIRLRPWKNGYSATLNGHNKALFSTARLPKREKLFKWAGPLFTYGIYFIKTKRNPIEVNSLEDAKKYTTTVAQGSADYVRLRELGFKRLDISPKAVSHARKLVNFRADLWLASELSYKKRAEKLGIDPNVFEKTFKLGDESLYIAFSKSTPDSVITQWQSTIDSIRQDGTYDKIVNKYIH